jgi:hypothetical protein
LKRGRLLFSDSVRRCDVRDPDLVEKARKVRKLEAEVNKLREEFAEKGREFDRYIAGCAGVGLKVYYDLVGGSSVYGQKVKITQIVEQVHYLEREKR